MRSSVVERKYLIPFILVTSMFFMWGLANNMTDTLLAAFKRIMSMTDFQTSWIQVAFYGSYFCLALPAAIFIRKFTYKSGILLGLGFFILGALLFYPASQTMVYGHFLTALFILAGGLSVLETTANPYILAMGSDESSVQRLNLAQAFNPIGSISGVLLSKFFILENLNTADATARAGLSAGELQVMQQQELSAVMGPYVGVALLLLVIWVTISVIKMPTFSHHTESIHLGDSLKKLFANSNYKWGVVAQFFYVGAQIGVWSYTIRYVMAELSLDESGASNYYLAALILFTVMRFAFTGLLKRFRGSILLIWSAFVAVGFLLIVIFVGGFVGVLALVGISGCMSLMFPTIFGLASQGLGQDRKIAGSGLIMAILGGAVLTAIQGQVSDISGSIHLSFFIPMICFLVVAYFGFSNRKMTIG
ncbi:L-fucose:H+ symporter permease [Rhodohalobacter sulfatireducens]|uniref:L-fucose:H+ symporter permease n=1 Tax=Rhodohalobacter sulfatireducens TaxID=2911366 RepID=A0ABS9KHS4_9BACT|nr:L-fucose:H+ symporter permease [Rhodohalobacter sulfatireducens]MCG2590404.1 L-fucose:H+ symporter permease [Rhodohalobacter sulfatireducens]